MTYAIYFPSHRHMLGSALLRRERTLPDMGVRIEVANMTRVSLTDVVMRGVKPAPFAVIEGARFFGLRKADELVELMEARQGDRIEEGQTLAIKSRGKRLLSPITGTIVYVGDGKIILQQTPGVVEVEAGMNGMVVEIVTNRSVTVEAYGGVLQGMWGNNRRAVGTLSIEPREGVEKIRRDAMDIELRGAIIVTRQPVRKSTLAVMEEQNFRGLIAPSMEASLVDDVLKLQRPVLLTEGFGSMRMNTTTINFLIDMQGKQVTLDAVLPEPLEPRLPEVVINVPLTGNNRPAPPNTTQPLRRGDNVRLRSGVTGKVSDLPKTPILLDNGLRMMCAHVELAGGEKVTVPLANIDYLG